MTIKGPSGTSVLVNLEGSGWMTENDWHQWRRMVRKKEHRRAQRHKVGYNAKADALKAGATIEQADKTGGAYYGTLKSAQHKAARKKGFKKLATKTTKVLHTKGGMILAAAGAVATVIPVVGWIAGPLISAAGGVLTAAQQARMAKRLQERRGRDLDAAKKSWEDGELTDEQYEARVKEIAGEEAALLVAEEMAARGEGEAEERPTAPDAKRRVPAPAPSPPIPWTKTKIATASIAIGVGVFAVLAVAIALGERKRA